VTDTQVLAVANQKGEVAKTTVASLGHPGVVLLEGDLRVAPRHEKKVPGCLCD